MFRKEVAVRPLLVWIFCGMTAPVVQLLAGYDVRSVGLMAGFWGIVLCLGLCGAKQPGRWTCLLQGLWLVVALGICGQYGAKSWPMAENDKMIPLVLLVLAAWSAQKGPATAARMAGVLLVLVCVGYGAILGTGVMEIKGKWMLQHEVLSPELGAFVLLLPGAAVCIPRQKAGKRSLWLLGVSLFAVVVAGVTCGNVHPGIHAGSYDFYEFCRGLSFFSLAERFEALVCALVTVGWFSLMNLLLSALGAAVQKSFPGWGQKAVWLGAAGAAGILLFNLTIPKIAVGLGAVIFWGLIPILTQGIDVVKNHKKSEKRG